MNETNHLPIFQVVGYKNSGKTLVTTALISSLTEQGYQVASLKHHGHGGEPDDVPGTDSARHRQAGAVISGVQGENELHFVFGGNEGLSWQQITAIYAAVSYDVLVLEGYKHYTYPKIVLIRNEADLQLLEEVDNIAAVGVHEQVQLPYLKCKTFIINEIDHIVPELTMYMLERAQEEQ
ncbi:molybdopterin-guanine dinucleotide biosynthesis protein B [Lentibacillus saliphilus]|uniref:molybdopterin-guanine dinucleotide biosynthesis protein B n=1 Tax=Lentibacillus saliphilus TaxID=2737028 RepID=UPI001C2F20DD|nr:molybdopterin-guanine dinucleotide biosynthesis protein B [Lentibacillus saliphilus]